MCNESVERSTERHHASITAGDVKRDAARDKLKADYRYALGKLLDGQSEGVWTPTFHRKSVPLPALFMGQIEEDDTGLAAELLAIAYALSCASGELETRDVRAKAVALITRLEDEHVGTHLDAAAEE